MGLFDRWLKPGKPDNRALERSMETLAKADSPEERRNFYALLRAASLMLATPGAEPGEQAPGPGRSIHIRFIATRDVDGSSAMLAFTNEDALRAWRPVGCTYTLMPTREIFRLALTAGVGTILINPFGPVGGRLTHREILTLAEGLDPGASEYQLSKENKIRVGTPAAPLADAIVAVLRTHATPAMRGLFHVTATIGHGTPHDLIGVELVPGAAAQHVIPELMAAVQPVLGQDVQLDFIPLRDDALSNEIRTRGLRLL